MNPGELRHRIYFRTPIEGRDANNGEAVLIWLDSDEVWAKVEHQEVGSGERMLQDKLTPMTTANITLRYYANITSQMRVVFDGLEYKILSVLPDAKKCFLTLETVQVGALRDQGLAEGDGEILQDSSGEALVLGDGDVLANYKAPGLTFTDSEGGSFTP